MPPQALEVLKIIGEQFFVYALGCGTHDVTAGMRVADDLLHGVAQALSLGLVFDFCRDADTATTRHEDQIA